MFLSYSRLKPWDSGVRLKASQHIWSLLFDKVKPVSHKPRIVNQHSVVYCFKYDLNDSNYVRYTTRHLFQRIADHRYSAIGRHLRDAHGWEH